MQLSIIIVNYNVKFFLEQCLLSVTKACKNIDAEIFVVDNHSGDGSREYLPSKFPQVTFTWRPDNIGFGKANNSVVSQCHGEYILFLNPDTIVPETAFTQCLSFFKSHPDCGALGVRMLDGSGRFLKESKRGLPTLKNSFFKMIGLANVFTLSSLFSGYYASHLPEKTTGDVAVLSGAFMMLSKKALDKTGGFDERFFMYAEDIDLSYRITRQGFKNYYFPEVTIIHFKGESTQRNNPDYARHFYGAMKLFVEKHYPQKKMLQFVSGLGILAGSIISKLKRKLVNPREINNNQNAVAVVAGQERFTRCVKILQHAHSPLLIVGRIKPNVQDEAAAIGSINEISQIIKSYKIAHLVFCEGELSFENIIKTMDTHAGKVGYLINAQGSKVIVGSTNKSANGLVISQP